ncbi:hypothetical protein AMAG_18566 [Allomyces macrogynus ATCC 38327]|uniref:Uncharacterized protein n=1 Tax=Allomyces macrogynus (strain ATCC 38327) TaxID=578462 RepID=A0A0L0SDV3_ALLM3|nr:hypothetical protein AMAG_18566 [Allomyces macrogynus ATCC 38327]|eukprot:KNE60612.1 hypothetical protein AMAG_18566 [Allomyces macrogynus ATCC 38327]
MTESRPTLRSDHLLDSLRKRATRALGCIESRESCSRVRPRLAAVAHRHVRVRLLVVLARRWDQSERDRIVGRPRCFLARKTINVFCFAPCALPVCFGEHDARLATESDQARARLAAAANDLIAVLLLWLALINHHQRPLPLDFPALPSLPTP